MIPVNVGMCHCGSCMDSFIFPMLSADYSKSLKPFHPCVVMVQLHAMQVLLKKNIYTPAQRSWRGGILDSPCLSVHPSVCRRHGFRSISQVCFGISISNFICMLMVAIGRSLLIFSDVAFKMAAWRPYWIFWFPDSNFTLALNINFKLQRHNTYVYG